jgi:ATP-dependent DNA helicase RecQ
MVQEASTSGEGEGHVPGNAEHGQGRAAAEGLFQVLRQVRKRIAEARRVPPYVIFSDKTLRAMARSRPTDPAGILRCPGVGDAKLEAYGALFLEAVREFLARS